MKFSTSKGVPTIRVKINGKGARLLIDTGANSSFIDKNLARRFKFKLREMDTNLHGAGGKVQMYDAYGVKVEGENGIIDVDWKAISFSNVRGMGIVGVLGSDYLITNKLKVDFSTKTLH